MVGRRMIPLRDTVPSARVPIVNYTIIAANVPVFCYEVSLARRARGDPGADLLLPAGDRGPRRRLPPHLVPRAAHAGGGGPRQPRGGGRGGLLGPRRRLRRRHGARPHAAHAVARPALGVNLGE